MIVEGNALSAGAEISVVTLSCDHSPEVVEELVAGAVHVQPVGSQNQRAKSIGYSAVRCVGIEIHAVIGTRENVPFIEQGTVRKITEDAITCLRGDDNVRQ